MRKVTSTPPITTLTHGLAEPQINAKVKALGETMPMSPKEFDTFRLDETAKWAEVVKFFGATAH